jgi:hypothetical protein
MRRIVLFTFLVAGCGNSGPAADFTNAWKLAGLDPQGFNSVDAKNLGGKCQAGKVSGVDTTLCEYETADAAKQAEAAGLAQVGETTGASLAQGKYLLVVADRGRSDPNGKKIRDIAAAFRNR